MKTIKSYGLTWEAHSPSLFVHIHAGTDVLVGFNGRGWQIGIGDTYRDREWPTRDGAMAAIAVALEDARRTAGDWHGEQGA
jgi:hypothetical protein